MKTEKNTHLPDWQRGEDSKTPPLERLALMQEWLSKNKQDILSKPVNHESFDEPVGFIDID